MFNFAYLQVNLLTLSSTLLLNESPITLRIVGLLMLLYCIGMIHPYTLSVVPFALIRACSSYKRDFGSYSAKKRFLIYGLTLLTYLYTILASHENHTGEPTSTMWPRDVYMSIFECNWGSVVSFIQRFQGIDKSTSSAIRSYQPSLGIRWYLDAQMLPEYQYYFDTLFAVLPIFCAGLICAYIVPHNLLVGCHIIMCILNLFKRHICVSDVLLMTFMLMQHERVVKRMAHLPWICTGILMPLCVSPIMLFIWIQYGTGNANYAFFQGLCLWLFSAVGISEFCASYQRIEYDDVEPK